MPQSGRSFARSVLLSFTPLRSTPALLQARPDLAKEKVCARPGRPFRAASVPLRSVVLRRTHRAQGQVPSLPVRSVSGPAFPPAPAEARPLTATPAERNRPDPSGTHVGRSKYFV